MRLDSSLERSVIQLSPQQGKVEAYLECTDGST